MRCSTPTTHRNIILYYGLTMAKNAIFVEGNWFFFWLRVMTHQQMGWIDAAAFTFGLMMEIPTGAISDMVGKRRTLLLAMAASVVGFFIMGSSETTAALVAGFLLTLVGGAFYSGADEALAYETLKQQGDEPGFERVISRANMLAILSLVLASLAGGALYLIDERLPYYAWGLACAAGFVCAWFMIEPDAESRPMTSAAYMQQMAAGFRQLAQPALRPFVPLILGLVGMMFLFSDGLIQPAVAQHMGFDATAQSVSFALIAVLAMGVTFLVPWLRQRFSAWSFMMALVLLMAVGFLGAGAVVGIGGFSVLVMIRLTGTVALPWVSIVVNQHVPSAERATTLSTVSLLTKIPYALTAVVAGQLAAGGKIGLFTSAIGVFLLGLMVVSTLFTLRPLAVPRLESTVEKGGVLL